MDAKREEGQALPLALGGALALIVAAMALVAIAGAITGKGRVQRAADLAAISAARSMRDDLPRLLSSPRLPNGSPNPRHIEKVAYIARARIAAIGAARADGVAPPRLRVSFPDVDSFAPVRVEAVVSAGIEAGEGDARTQASAVAEAGAPSTAAGQSSPAMASGGGYGGPLVYRQGHGMRPDVGAAFDLMAAAARQVGFALIVNSAFRSDAEQAALFAAHPDPTWVAPPGHSLHRCGTELDLGPETAYGWLAANAARFGFVQRYSWVLPPVSEGLSRGQWRFLQVSLRTQASRYQAREGVQSLPPLCRSPATGHRFRGGAGTSARSREARPSLPLRLGAALAPLLAGRRSSARLWQPPQLGHGA